MKLPARVGVTVIVGLLTCGAMPAVHAAVAPTTSQTPSDGSQQESATSSLAMSCQINADNEHVTIDFPSEVPFDELTVSVNDQSVAPQSIDGSSVILDAPESGGTVELELWKNESLTGECAQTLPSLPSKPPPPPETSQPPATATPTPTPTPTDSESPAPPVSPTPTQTTPAPTPTPTPTPSETPSKSPSPTPSTSSSPTATSSDSPMSTWPTVRPEDTTQGTAQRPYAGAQQQQQPDPIGPRNIRQFSNDPRYLLPQLLGIPAQSGSELIMPRPRDADQGPPDLETLPPVSEDELEAIKARLAAPNRADQPAGNAQASADEQVSDQSSPWLWLAPSLIVVAGLGGVTFWLLKRRQHDL